MGPSKKRPYSLHLWTLQAGSTVSGFKGELKYAQVLDHLSYLVDLLRQLVEVCWRGPVPRHVVVLPEDVAPRGVEAEGAQDQHEVRPLETLQCHQDTKLKISATSKVQGDPSP